jgi:dihydrolipoamide dehydrogenase
VVVPWSSHRGRANHLGADVVLLDRRPNTDGLGSKPRAFRSTGAVQIEVSTMISAQACPASTPIGDVAPGPMLAHKAEDEASPWPNSRRPDRHHHSRGDSQRRLHQSRDRVGRQDRGRVREAGVEIKTGKFPMMANSRAKTNRDTDGFVKIIADARTDRVLGVHIIATLAGTMIAQAAQAMEFGATSEDIAYTCHAHPTHSEAIKEAAMAVTGKPIHI